MNPKTELMLYVMDEMADWIVHEQGCTSPNHILARYDQIKKIVHKQEKESFFVSLKELMEDKNAYEELFKSFINGEHSRMKRDIEGLNMEEISYAEAHFCELIESLQEKGINLINVLLAIEDAYKGYSEEGLQ